MASLSEFELAILQRMDDHTKVIGALSKNVEIQTVQITDLFNRMGEVEKYCATKKGAEAGAAGAEQKHERRTNIIMSVVSAALGAAGAILGNRLHP